MELVTFDHVLPKPITFCPLTILLDTNKLLSDTIYPPATILPAVNSACIPAASFPM